MWRMDYVCVVELSFHSSMENIRFEPFFSVDHNHVANMDNLVGLQENHIELQDRGRIE